MIVEGFIDAVAASLRDGSFVRLTLGCWRGAASDVLKATARIVDVRGTTRFSVVRHCTKRDVTENFEPGDAAVVVRRLLSEGFMTARLFSSACDVQLDWNPDGGHTIARSPASMGPASREHDKAKRRMLSAEAPFLVELGVAGDAGRIFPSMSAKWKQINKFVEVLDAAVADSALAGRSGTIAIADFGCGKGYLTFAIHHHLQSTLGRDVAVTGVEQREDLVEFCNSAASKLGLAGIRFIQGTLDSIRPESLDILVALHACDTATDEAIAMGIEAGASVIVCAPCCHKEVRPQLKPPEVLRPLLRFGIHAAQESEMITDAARALLLEANGYAANVFEFISREHTDKNKMILGVRKKSATRKQQAMSQLAAIKDFYGASDLRLERLLAGPGRGSQSTSRQDSRDSCAP